MGEANTDPVGKKCGGDFANVREETGESVVWAESEGRAHPQETHTVCTTETIRLNVI